MPVNQHTPANDTNKGPLQFKRGTLQLWQFLVYLLDANKSDIIQWVSREQSTFKLCDPEEVARQWGAQKNRQTMNYDKLSRSLRYYYEKGIMQKVSGERYVYKFMCDTNLNFDNANIAIVEHAHERKSSKQRNFHKADKYVVHGKVKLQQHQQPYQAHFKPRYAPYSVYTPTTPYNQYNSSTAYNEKLIKQELNHYSSPNPDYKSSPASMATTTSPTSLMMSPVSGLAAQHSQYSTSSTPCSLQYQNALHIHHYHLYQPQAQQTSAQNYSLSNYYPNAADPASANDYKGNNVSAIIPLKTQFYLSSPAASSTGSTSLATPSSVSSSYYQPDLSSYSVFNDSLNTQYNDYWY
jgi:hypothetical protein